MGGGLLAEGLGSKHRIHSEEVQGEESGRRCEPGSQNESGNGKKRWDSYKGLRFRL